MAVSVRSWLANEAGKHFVLMLWLAANTWLFLDTYLLYSTGQQYHYLYQMLGLGLCISRASASVLNLNCSLVLLPMCRSLLTFIRGSRKMSSRRMRRLLDKSKSFHVACGVAICIFSAVHVSAHLVNVFNFSASFSEDFPALNLARFKGEDPKFIIFTTIPGVSGVLLVLILLLMFISSSHWIRMCNYEIFWYTHSLFIIFYIILMVHMVGGALKYQTNIEAHPPGCLRANQSLQEQQGEDLDQKQRCKEEADFQPHSPQTWLWVSGPLCLYCVERLHRYIRSSHPVTIVTVIRHPCDVVELRMLKKNFRARPGQYILLNCPGVSSFENHPFTLTACPTKNKETFGIHLRIVGDWTEHFAHLLLPQPRAAMEVLPVVHQRRYPTLPDPDQLFFRALILRPPANKPRIIFVFELPVLCLLYHMMTRLYVDGPFGSPSEEVFNYDVSLCVAGGIGVTPFACVLDALIERWQSFRLQRLYFVWVCRELQSFYWFAELLCALHEKLWQENRPDYLNVKLYVTHKDSLQSMSELRYRPLAARLQIGRPRWKLLFDEIGKSNKDKRVGVFCCGPKGISRTLHRLCNSVRSSGTTFEFNKESFS